MGGHLSKMRCVLLSACVAITLLCASAQQDGNPHNWDRTRRCDQIDYSPPCGPCEGIGGIPWGDKNEEYSPTSCTPLGNASTVTAGPRPVWGEQQTIQNYYEVLIGKKNDPFCFEAFPGNDSVGALCYRPQQGMQIYDSRNAKALKYSVQVKTKVGNLSSTVMHQGPYMWIVNKLPWYAAGIHQCICTEPRQGGDWSTPAVYPIMYNWTNNLQFVGREKIGIEYIEPHGEAVLDHWAFGPHHVWSFPNNGSILRMWQPFNGLEVYPAGTGPSDFDPTVFDDIPPAMCKKGGAKFRIKCSDDGMPVHKNKTATELTPKDSARAHQKIPRAEYRGESFDAMSNTLNQWLAKSNKVAPCQDWSTEDLQQLQATLYMLRDEALDDVYQKAKDNRRIRATINELQDTWSLLKAQTTSDQLQTMARDGHCHETVMWFVHHLTTESQQLISELGITLPLLSMERHSCPEEQGHPVCRAYEEQVTCASCHSNYVPSS